MIEIFVKTILILAAILAAFYCAYAGGLLTIHSHASVLYVGRINKARFSKCNGTFKRIIKLGEAKPYSFTLSCKLTEGSVEVFVTDKEKKTLLSLDSQNTTGIINVKEPSRYTLNVKINKASGSYELDWD
mgnify:CR=1 FL=1